MLVHIAKVLDAATLENARSAIAGLAFQDGRTTAGWHARTVKRNQQAVASPELAKVQQTIIAALSAHPVFASIARPKLILAPLISRSGPGEGYGTHVDDALIGGEGTRIRSDLSVTVFLSDPQGYAGGELVVETPSGEETAKGAAGDAIVYPSTTLHRVMPVSSGERLVAVTWVQSLVRDAEIREMLFDLDRARRAIFDKDGKTPAFDLVSKTYSNLLRRHVEL